MDQLLVELGNSKLHREETIDKYYFKNLIHNMLVACDRCSKWRRVKEYQEVDDVPDFFECSMWNLNGEKGNCYIPQLEDDTKYTNGHYSPGSIVWAKMKGHPRWPAMVEDHPEELRHCKDLQTEPKYHVVFLDEKVSRSWIVEKCIEPFIPPSSDKIPFRPPKLKRAVETAMEAMKMKREDRLLTYSFAARYANKKTRSQGKNKLEIKPGTSYNKCQLSENYAPGDLVWIERARYPRWPGMVENDPVKQIYINTLYSEVEYHIVFFDERASRAWIKKSSIKPFSDPAEDEGTCEKVKKAIENAKKAKTMSKQERLTTFSFSVRNGKRRLEAGNNACRKKRSYHEVEAVRQSPELFEDLDTPEIQYMKSICGYEEGFLKYSKIKVRQNNGIFKQYQPNYKLPPKKEMTKNLLDIDEKSDDDDYLYQDVYSCGSECKRMSSGSQDSVYNDVTTITSDSSENEEEIRILEKSSFVPPFQEGSYPSCIHPYTLSKLDTDK
ncbi:DNA mismatch repair protein Msh6-like isoform X2 [Argiope bruennichi]|uniref:DNA mismatch repair protein Msh6-like isoform X2 n=2 Tax=Argiope bruennichi TaxID=94029 RepID=UPI00249440A9|nr:DNA mismatch repair protein Msh6-like isoform X2 [Argiope bruennichi]